MHHVSTGTTVPTLPGDSYHRLLLQLASLTFTNGAIRLIARCISPGPHLSLLGNTIAPEEMPLPFPAAPATTSPFMTPALALRPIMARVSPPVICQPDPVRSYTLMPDAGAMALTACGMRPDSRYEAGSVAV